MLSADRHLPMVMAAAAQGVTQRTAAAGVDPDDVLCAAGLLPSDLTDPTRRIALSRYCQIFEIAARKTCRASFGLEFGAAFHPQQLGMLGYLAISATTLGAALRKFTAYLPAHQQATHLAVRNLGDGRAMVEYAIVDASIKARQQDAELSIAMLFNFFRHCLGSRWVPLGIHLMHAKPSGQTRYQELLGVRPLFAQTSNRIVFRRSELDCPMPRRDEELVRLLEAQLERQLAQTEAYNDILARARHEVTIGLETGNCELEQIAKRCGLPPWTLKRRLKQRGFTFQELLTSTRRALAIDQLSRGIPVTEIASALGYSQISAFSRAFRQWTGLSPRNFVSRDTRLDSEVSLTPRRYLS